MNYVEKINSMKKYLMLMMMMTIWMYGGSYYFDVTSQAVFPAVYLRDCGIDFGDFNRDGLVDFMVGGWTFSKFANFYLYKQNTSLVFCDITNGATFPSGVPLGFFNGRPLFVDVNGDGSMDLFYTGASFSPAEVTNVYLQIGTSGIFWEGNNVSFPSGLPQASGSYADFADADNDGFLDLLLIGFNIPFYLFRQNASHGYGNIANTS